MIMQALRAGALAASLVLAGCLGESTPQEKLASIEALQAESFTVTENQQARLDELVAKGKAAMAEGKDEAAAAAFDEALEILKYAKDAALYNKAE